MARATFAFWEVLGNKETFWKTAITEVRVYDLLIVLQQYHAELPNHEMFWQCGFYVGVVYGKLVTLRLAFIK